MKPNNKMFLALLAIANLSLMPTMEAKLSLNSFSQKAQDSFKKASQNTGAAYDNFKQSLRKARNKTEQIWHNLSPESKAALIAGLATVGAATVAGAGYAATTRPAHVQGIELEDIWAKLSPEDQEGLLNDFSSVTAESYGTPFVAKF